MKKKIINIIIKTAIVALLVYLLAWTESGDIQYLYAGF